MEKKTKTAEEVKGKLLTINHQQAIVLRMGAWKTLFETDQYKLIIARTLNKCTWNEGLIINGYLITNSSLYLLLKIEEAELDEMLGLIYTYLKLEIEEHHVEVKQLDLEGNYHIDNFRTEMLLVNLFEAYALYDEDLIKLITGRPLHLLYHNPAIEKLKEKISRSKYCSAIDYTGATGPVIIQRY